MTEILHERMTAQIDETHEELAVVLIGMRVNRLWKLHRWVPVALAMGRMVRELAQQPDSPLLGYQSWIGNPSIMVQYWRSFEEMEAYAKDRMREHLPAWADFGRRTGSAGDVGIWHETYLVEPGKYECVYNHMPNFGLAAASRRVSATGRLKTATGRLGRSDGDDFPDEIKM